MKLLKCLGFVLFFLALSAGYAIATSDSSAISYKKTADYYNRMKASNKNLTRKQLERGLKMFKEIYTKYPRGSKTPEALYMSGFIHEELFRNYHKQVDKDSAVTIYRILIRSYPNSSLADDALYNSGGLHLLENRNIEALSDFRGILRWFPKSDSAPNAKLMIAKLEKEVREAKDVRKKVAVKTPAEEPDFKEVRHWGNAKYARVVFEVSKGVNYKISGGNDGKEITVDLLGVESAALNEKPINPKNSIVRAIQVSPLNNEISRVQISLRSAATYSAMELSNPERVVVDINLDHGGQATGAETQPQPAAKETQTPRDGKVSADGMTVQKPSFGLPPIVPLAAPTLSIATASIDPGLKEAGLAGEGEMSPEPGEKDNAGPDNGDIEKVSFPQAKGFAIRTIVIDPGHGGKDPGAIGKGGLREKDITLDIAHRLKARLQRDCKCRVLLTRSTDVFIPLEERTAFANTSDADLFVSIHVNSNLNGRAKGVETYFLSPARSKTESYVAARENMLAMNSENQDMNDLAFILFDMQNTDKINESSRMAATIQSALVKEITPAYNVKNNGVKQAMFYVLHGAKMPSILVETSFISNIKEERLLRKTEYREEIASGIAHGVVNFAKETKMAFLNE